MKNVTGRSTAASTVASTAIERCTATRTVPRQSERSKETPTATGNSTAARTSTGDIHGVSGGTRLKGELHDAYYGEGGAPRRLEMYMAKEEVNGASGAPWQIVRRRESSTAPRTSTGKVRSNSYDHM